MVTPSPTSLRERVEKGLPALAEKIIAQPLSKLGGAPNLSQTVHYEPLHTRHEPFDLNQTNEAIAGYIRSGEPFFVGRFGSTELRATLRWFNRTNRTRLEKMYGALALLEAPYFSRFENRKLRYDSGFFPIDSKSVAAFSQLIIDSMPALDLLASWVPGENIFEDQLRHAHLTTISHLEPFFANNPWSSALAGKKVLVIHPFSESIEAQYHHARAHLFAHPQMLPDFELNTIRAVQSLGRPDTRFATWFDGLKWMIDEALSQDFDVAIIGCGAYGFPLSARLKIEGRRVIHLGGVTQMLFGIGGKRWDGLPNHRALYNAHWVRPQEHENPQRRKKLGQASYW